MAKPSSITTWATDAGATADPGATRKATGFLAGKKLPARWLNWILNQNGAWFTYLRDLHIEPEFLNKNYSWTGAHGFSNGTVGFFQSPVIGGTSNDFLYGSALGVVEKRQRETVLPLSAFWSETGNALVGTGEWWVRSNTPATVIGAGGSAPSFAATWGTYASHRRLITEFTLPDGAVMNGFRIGIQTAATGGSIRVEYGRVLRGPGFAVAANQASEAYSNWGVTLPVADNILDHTLSALEQQDYCTADNARGPMTLRIFIDSGNPVNGSGGFSLFVNWVQIRWLDPGPRNY